MPTRPASTGELHKRVIMGVEVEAYSITTSTFRVGRRISRPVRPVSEKGERFTRDASIGSEYNSRPFATIREAFFLLKSGLRKYFHALYDSKKQRESTIPLLVGGWLNRFAGTHIHISLDGAELTLERAKRLTAHIHDHVPLLIAMGANSPIWGNLITSTASNRILKGSPKYFRPLVRGALSSEDMNEFVFNRGRKRKPATLELRFLDSNIPEYVVAAMSVVKAACLGHLRRGRIRNRIRHAEYIQSREEAAVRGMRAYLCWNGKWMKATDYLDRYLLEYHDEFRAMDVPEDIFEIFRLLKREYNGSRLLLEGANIAKEEHPQTWRRRFAKRYAKGIELLLSGNSIWDLAEAIEVQLPPTSRVWLGRKGLILDG